jgi:hypothetical protein
VSIVKQDTAGGADYHVATGMQKCDEQLLLAAGGSCVDEDSALQTISGCQNQFTVRIPVSVSIRFCIGI